MTRFRKRPEQLITLDTSLSDKQEKIGQGHKGAITTANQNSKNGMQLKRRGKRLLCK